MPTTRFYLILITLLGPLLLPGCANVPKEVVELSYTLGQDLAAVHESYSTLIDNHFEALRQQRLDYLNNEWKPVFLRKWVKQGRLLEVAQGHVVWSREDRAFVAPTPGQAEAQQLDTLQVWAANAIDQLDKKQKALLEPLEQDERALQASVDDAFTRLDRANATITAHLNSLRKVREVQDEALQAMNLKDLRDRINQMLVKTSDQAEHGLDAIRKADGLLDKLP